MCRKKDCFIPVLFIIVFLLVICIFTGMVLKYKTNIEKNTDFMKIQDVVSEKNMQIEKTAFVSELMTSMSLGEKIYQLFFVKPETIIESDPVVSAGEETSNALAQYPVGGIIYFSENIQTREQTIEMIKNSQDYSKIPLCIGVDEEGGTIARIGNNVQMGTTKLPSMEKIGSSGDSRKAYEIGETLAADIGELGFNVDFAPVADIIVNKKNTEIGDRSFGEDPELVSEMVIAEVKGLQENNVSAVLKHFPGHGSTVSNSHEGNSVSLRTLEELEKAEFVPFREGIEAGADFVLVSHMTLVNATKEKVPASLSGEVITGWLKGKLNYDGIVITDALRMKAISDDYSSAEAAVKTIKAGSDMILMPENVYEAYNGIADAVENGDITEERIDSSVKKILNLKFEKGLLH